MVTIIIIDDYLEVFYDLGLKKNNYINFFKKMDDFIMKQSGFNKDTPIYIDVGMDGGFSTLEHRVLTLRKYGFNHIYIQSSEITKTIENCSFIQKHELIMELMYGKNK